jgi:hypothetical protein
MVELHTMPRAVAFPETQEEILNYYRGKGLMTYDPENPEEKLIGKYRPVNDGKSSMARMRFMPTTELLDQPKRMVDMIKGTSAFIKKLSEASYPMHTYPTDPTQGIPSVLMSYTALEEPVRAAYEAAGFSLEENAAFKEFWAPEHHDELPSKMVIAAQFIHTIDSELMEFKIQ